MPIGMNFFDFATRIPKKIRSTTRMISATIGSGMIFNAQSDSNAAKPTDMSRDILLCAFRKPTAPPATSKTM